VTSGKRKFSEQHILNLRVAHQIRREKGLRRKRTKGPIPHGKYYGYVGRGCRCEACTRANREHQRAYESMGKLDYHKPARKRGRKCLYCGANRGIDKRRRYCSEECRIEANVPVRRATWSKSKRLHKLLDTIRDAD